jgi:hypothetical protein
MLDLDAIEARAEAATLAFVDLKSWRGSHLPPLANLIKDAAIELAATAADVPALVAELRAAREVLVFADGLAVANTGFPLAALYAEDCEWAQQALKAAGCFPAAYRAV